VQRSTSTIRCLLPIDRRENLRTLTGNKLLATMAILAVEAGKADGLPISPSVEGVWAERARLEHASRESKAGDALLEACREVSRLAGKPVTFFLDGLEKAEPTVVSKALRALASVPDEVGLVVVVPLTDVYGQRTELIRPGERIVTHGPVVGPMAYRFFGELLARRLSQSWQALTVIEAFSVENLVHQLQTFSSGLPRDFLQLAADAATYARLNRGGEWPDDSDLTAARADFIESFRRALQPGDVAALRQVDGTDGRELELGRKLRLLTQGMLVETTDSPGIKLMRPHNLVRPLLGNV